MAKFIKVEEKSKYYNNKFYETWINVDCIVAITFFEDGEHTVDLINGNSMTVKCSKEDFNGLIEGL